MTSGARYAELSSGLLSYQQMQDVGQNNKHLTYLKLEKNMLDSLMYIVL